MNGRIAFALALGMVAIGVAIAAGVAVSSSGPALPAAKQAPLNAWPPAGAAAPAPKDASSVPPAAAAAPPPDAGRIELESRTPVQVPISPAIFTATSAWTALRGPIKLHVFAGASSADPSVGEIFLVATDQRTGLPVAPTGLYEDPVRDGELTLTAVGGNIATFATPSGTVGRFDLGTAGFKTP